MTERKTWKLRKKKKLKGLVHNLKSTDKSLILCAKRTGAWLNVCGTKVSGKVLTDTEFGDFLCARYSVYPLTSQRHCDGCGTAFAVAHVLSCIIGGLFIARHNEIRVEILYLSLRAFTSASVCAEPLIHQGRTRYEQDIRKGSEKDKKCREM